MREMMQNNRILGGFPWMLRPTKKGVAPYFQTHPNGPNHIGADTSHCIPFYHILSSWYPGSGWYSTKFPTFLLFKSHQKKNEQKHESPAMLRTLNTSTIIIINIKYVYIYVILYIYIYIYIHTYIYIYLFIYLYYTSAGGFRPTKYESLGIILQKRANH